MMGPGAFDLIGGTWNDEAQCRASVAWIDDTAEWFILVRYLDRGSNRENPITLWFEERNIATRVCWEQSETWLTVHATPTEQQAMEFKMRWL